MILRHGGASGEGKRELQFFQPQKSIGELEAKKSQGLNQGAQVLSVRMDLAGKRVKTVLASVEDRRRVGRCQSTWDIDLNEWKGRVSWKESEREDVHTDSAAGALQQSYIVVS